jgi:aryl-alcohol dehydrogenase-like predicted oxidoreductase
LPWNDDFGQQNTEAEGHAQMDYALENGVNFLILLRCILFQRIKIPWKPERIIGTWLKNQAREIVLASKIAGPNPNFGYMREKLDFQLASSLL